MKEIALAFNPGQWDFQECSSKPFVRCLANIKWETWEICLENMYAKFILIYTVFLISFVFADGAHRAV